MMHLALQPASALAQVFGVKMLAYGGPGMGKTPMVKTAPSPVLCVAEPGMLSMRDATNIPAWAAYNVQAIDDFFSWLHASTEAKQFDTVAVDSISQIAEIYLAHFLGINKDPRKAYGEMARRVMEIVNQLYFMPSKHVYLIAKQTVVDESGAMRKKPYFPGQDLNVKVPHLYDEIIHIGHYTPPGVTKPIIAFRTKDTYDTLARDRSGKLNELEPADLSALFAKCMSN